MNRAMDWLRNRLRPLRRLTHLPVIGGQLEYAMRLRAELATFRDQHEVHALPEIFHYWSNRYLRPKLEELGYSHPEDFFVKEMMRCYDEVAAHAGRPARFVSIGAGNCDAEVRLGTQMLESGRGHFVFECMDINPDMLKRGRVLAAEAGLDDRVRPLQADFNEWKPQGRYDLVLANQSLHHVSNLEGLFDAIAKAIGDSGCFVTSDMIGRNGHARWPEALELVQEYWQELPSEYRYNRQLRRQEDQFMDWDCSVGNFEGIRAQDILPLLLQRFGFTLFLAYGNVISPFVDRSFGHNFDADGDWDRDFIDRVHARDEQEMLAGHLKPTQMMAVMVNQRDLQPRVWKHLTPEFCLRRPD